MDIQSYSWLYQSQAACVRASAVRAQSGGHQLGKKRNGLKYEEEKEEEEEEDDDGKLIILIQQSDNSFRPEKEEIKGFISRDGNGGKKEIRDKRGRIFLPLSFLSNLTSKRELITYAHT